MINKTYIKEALNDVISVVENKGIATSIIIDIENPRDLYIFHNDTYVKVNYLYKASNVDEKTYYMSLLDFTNVYPDFMKDNNIRFDFMQCVFIEEGCGCVVDKELDEIFKYIEVSYFENLI